MRAEELINDIFKQKTQLSKSGHTPEMIVMSKNNYDLLEDYRRRLTPFPDGVPDYITQYTIFGLPIFIDNGCECMVRHS